MKKRRLKLGVKIPLCLMIIVVIVMAFTIIFLKPDSIYSESMYNDIEFLLAIIMLFLIMLAVVAGSNYAIRVLAVEPLNKLAKFVREYSAADETTRHEMTNSGKEFELSSQNEIFYIHEAIKKLIASMNDYAAKLKEDSKLKSDLESAQVSNEAKTTFLSNMSHEIRTPINTILGMNEMILRETADDTMVVYANDIQSAGRTLLSLIDDVLDFSKVENGTLEILPQEYELSSMITDLVNMISAKAEEKGLQLEMRVNENTPNILYGDEIRIKQCILNILNNAVKYTSVGRITFLIDYETLGDYEIMLKVSVKDTGIGIRKENIAKICNPFVRIDEDKNSFIEGTGLGMSIVNNLLRLMDSHIIVESEYGKGSEFSFKLRQNVIKWARIGKFEESYQTAVLNNSKYEPSFKAPEAVILVVDDTAMNIKVIEGLIKNTRVRLKTALSGYEALDMMKKEKFDIIFMDHRMPGMDGIETLQTSRKMADNMNMFTPIIALTANVVQGAKEMFLDNGFNDYLSKPVDSVKLEQTIIEYLPQDKIILKGSREYDAIADVSDDFIVDNEEYLTLIKNNIDLTKIDLNEAMNNCGGAEILVNVMKDFYDQIDTKSALIQQLWKDKQIKDYTIQVHALKSSSRLIGATRLSAMAKALEECGDNKDTQTILMRTPELIILYRSYKDILEPLVNADRKDEDNLMEISEDEFLGAIGNISECIEAFDFDTADQIVDMLKEYKIPHKYKEIYDNIKIAIKEVDRDKTLEIIKNLL